MDKERIKEKIIENGVVVIIRVNSSELAEKATYFLYENGLKSIEISTTSPRAIEVIKSIKTKLADNIILGAGTILDSETGRMALLAGADFLVTPILKKRIIKLSNRYNSVLFSGASTPTEIMKSWELGADFIKVFPARALGGPSFIKDILGPFPYLNLAPTGGITIENTGDYLRAGATVVCIGSSLINSYEINAGKFDSLIKKCQILSQVIKQAREK